MQADQAEMYDGCIPNRQRMSSPVLAEHPDVVLAPTTVRALATRLPGDAPRDNLTGLNAPRSQGELNRMTKEGLERCGSG
jgi:hypothetical protein